MARWPAALFVVAVLSGSATAHADDRKWELEFVGGAAFPIGGGAGDVALPPPNSTVAGPGPSPARIVSSWYFGDGASQLNQAIASQAVIFRTNPALIPLDDVLKSRFAERGAGPTIGVRATRVLTPRFAAEFTFEAANTALRIDSSSISGLEASRLSFINAWNGVLVLSASGAQSVTSVATTEDNRGRQLVSTGTLIVNLTAPRRLTPYVAAGGGVVASGDDNPSAQLVGRYHYVFPPVSIPIPVPPPQLNIDETDTVTIRSAFENRFAFVIGGGVKYSMTPRFSVRLDVRDLMYSNPQRTELDAAPSTVPNPASGLILGTVPNIVFGSSPVVRSTLSGGAISHFETFHGTGVIHQIHATGGLIWRF